MLGFIRMVECTYLFMNRPWGLAEEALSDRHLLVHQLYLNREWIVIVRKKISLTNVTQKWQCACEKCSCPWVLQTNVSQPYSALERSPPKCGRASEKC